MSTSRFLSAIFVSALLWGTSVLADESLLYLRSLRDRDPAQDALEAIHAGRLQFLAVGGYASSVPGVDREDCLVDRRLADLLPGTGDTWNTSEQQTLQKIASEYAYKFNLVIKADLERNNIPLKCFK